MARRITWTAAAAALIACTGQMEAEKDAGPEGGDPSCACDRDQGCSAVCVCDEDCDSDPPGNDPPEEEDPPGPEDPPEQEDPPGQDDPPEDDPPEPTTCSILVAPEEGTTESAFVTEIQSSGWGCAVAVDGAEPFDVPCWTGPVPFVGADVGVGHHSVVLTVADGPDGPAHCETDFTITEATTCWIGVLPESGTLEDAFVAAVDTNGASCRLVYDGADLGEIDCDAPDTTFHGSDFGIGVHTATLDVLEGPGGPRSCSTTFEVR